MTVVQSVLVLGATGNQGGALIKYLVASDKSFTIFAVTRDASSPKTASLAALPGVTVVAGDMAHPAATLFSHGQVDGLFLMQVSQSPEELEQAKGIIDAAVAHGVQYIVHTGVDLSGVARSDIPSFDTKRDIWAYLKTQPVRSTYLGPTGFMSTFLWPGMAETTQTWPSGYKHKYIDTDDIGHVAAECFQEPDKFSGREIMLAGDSVSAHDIKLYFQDILGQALVPKEMHMPHVKQMMDQLVNVPFVANVDACKAEFPYIKDLPTWLSTTYKTAMGL